MFISIKINVVLIMFSSIFFGACNSTEPTIPEEVDINIVIQKLTIYDTENSGIPDNSIRSLAVDNQNNLWVGSADSGVAKFDGSNWTVYNTHNSGLSNNSINCITVDYNNDVWIGTDNGLAKFNGQNWTVYDTTNSPLPYHVIFSLVVDKNNLLWIGCGHLTAGGVLTFDGNKWELYTKENSILPSSIINTIHIDNKNNKWIGTAGGLVKIGDDNSWNVYTAKNWKLSYDYNSVDAIMSDLDGNIWLGFKAWIRLDYGYFHGALLQFDGNNWTDYSPHANGKYDSTAIVSNRVAEIVCDKYGYLWIATETEWKFPYNLSIFKNGVWKNLSDIAQDFPINPFINDIKIDKNNTVWLAGTQLGVISINYSIKQFFQN
jgi:ligand-binding sensor domain-containing protein